MLVYENDALGHGWSMESVDDATFHRVLASVLKSDPHVEPTGSSTTTLDGSSDQTVAELRDQIATLQARLHTYENLATADELTYAVSLRSLTKTDAGAYPIASQRMSVVLDLLFGQIASTNDEGLSSVGAAITICILGAWETVMTARTGAISLLPVYYSWLGQQHSQSEVSYDVWLDRLQQGLSFALVDATFQTDNMDHNVACRVVTTDFDSLTVSRRSASTTVDALMLEDFVGGNEQFYIAQDSYAAPTFDAILQGKISFEHDTSVVISDVSFFHQIINYLISASPMFLSVAGFLARYRGPLYDGQIVSQIFTEFVSIARLDVTGTIQHLWFDTGDTQTLTGIAESPSTETRHPSLCVKMSARYRFLSRTDKMSTGLRGQVDYAFSPMADNWYAGRRFRFSLLKATPSFQLINSVFVKSPTSINFEDSGSVLSRFVPVVAGDLGVSAVVVPRLTVEAFSPVKSQTPKAGPDSAHGYVAFMRVDSVLNAWGYSDTSWRRLVNFPAMDIPAFVAVTLTTSDGEKRYYRVRTEDKAVALNSRFEGGEARLRLPEVLARAISYEYYF